MRVVAVAPVASLLAGAAFAYPGGASVSSEAFRMPSGNIGCMYQPISAARAFLRCDILSGLRPAPPRPASCDLDHGFFLSRELWRRF